MSSSTHNYITELYRDLEAKYKPGFFDWLEAFPERYSKYAELIKNVEKSMKTDNVPNMEYHGGVYKKFMLEQLSDFAAAWEKAKVRVAIAKLAGSLHETE